MITGCIQRFARLLALGGATAAFVSAAAPPEPARVELIPPELVYRHADEIGLTGEQERALAGELAGPNEAVRQANEKLKQESAAFNALLARERPEEAAVLEQLDRLLAAERDAKRARLQMMLRLNPHLTPAQRDRLLELKKHPPAAPTNETQARVTAKLERLKQLAEDRRRQGLPPRPGREFWQQVEPSMQAGNWNRAERMIDSAIEALESGRRRGPRR
jgi:hypothetical protein